MGELRTTISPGTHTEDDIPDIARVLTFDEDDEEDDTENDCANNDMDSYAYDPDDDDNADCRSQTTTASPNTIHDRDDDHDEDDAWNIDTVITTMTEEFQIIMNEWNIPTPMKTKRRILDDDGSVIESSSPSPRLSPC